MRPRPKKFYKHTLTQASRSVMAMSYFGAAYTTIPTTLFIPSIARHGPFFRPGEGIKRHRRSVAAAIMNGASPGVHDAHQRPSLRKNALLISDSSDVASIARGEGLAGLLASQGFRVASLESDQAPRVISGLLEADAAVIPFDLSGRAGRELTDICEAAGVAGLYSFKPATGMFKKVRVFLARIVNSDCPY